MKKEKEVKEEKDEFDMLVESSAKNLDDRLGSSPDKLEKKKRGGKQTTLPFKPVKKEKSKDDSSDDDEINFDTLSPPREPRNPRRAAAAGE